MGHVGLGSQNGTDLQNYLPYKIPEETFYVGPKR